MSGSLSSAALRSGGLDRTSRFRNRPVRSDFCCRRVGAASRFPLFGTRLWHHRGGEANSRKGDAHESQRRRRLHARGGAALPRPAGSRPGPRGLCREDEGGDRRRRRHRARGLRRDDEGLGADERSRDEHVAPDARADDEAALTDTIFALSSGAPPAAIAVVRISGPRAHAALHALAETLPEPRTARLAALQHDGELLDNALIIRFPGPHSATGEDVAELHLHGGRSVVAAVLAALAGMAGLREAGPGGVTRRAFEAGRLDPAEAEGLAD